MMGKHFYLACPHCEDKYAISEREIDDFYNSHVLWCKRIIKVSSLLTPIRRIWEAARHGQLIEIPDGFYLRGMALLKRFDGFGNLSLAYIGKNLVVDAGRAMVIDRMQTTSPAVPDYEGIGTGTGSPAAGDTALGVEIGTRIQGALSQPTATTDRLVSTFPAGNGTGAITEAGRFNALSGVTLYTRLTFSAINKAAADSLQITHDVTD